MGSKQSLSNGREPEELTDLVAAFELHNSVKIVLSASLGLHHGYLDLEWTATALLPEKAGQEVTGLDLVSVTEWGGAYKTLMGVATRLLYSLDFALASAEFDKAIIK